MANSRNDGLAGTQAWAPVAQAAQGIHRALVHLSGNLARASGGLQLPSAPLPTRRQLAAPLSSARARTSSDGRLCSHVSGLSAAGFATIEASSARGQGARGAMEVAGLAVARPGGPVSREELGRATWTLLHTTAAQFPEKPTRRQQRDAKQLVGAVLPSAVSVCTMPVHPSVYIAPPPPLPSSSPFPISSASGSALLFPQAAP